MCGICGRINFNGEPVAPIEIAAMRDIMLHRGPDDEGLFIDGVVGLGHRRLSIIDLAGGRQPISNEDGKITVVYNGEIYNFGELRQQLIDRGHKLTTRCDTEVIVHLYEDLGPSCVQRFRGMFSFAIWDGVRKRLMLARDRLGIKPLYYFETADSLVFASEIKSVLQAQGVPRTPDPRGLYRYLTYRHAYGTRTLFNGIRQLQPGHILIAEAGDVKVRRYWDVPRQEFEVAAPYTPEEFFPLLEEAVRLRMISDVPIGVFLSGGVDSSAVTALMARHTDHVRTFSIGFVPGEENELEWAKLVADTFHTEHHEFVLGPQDFFSLLKRLVWHHDEPLTFPASIPLYLLSRESKRLATVMLAGEGADELLAGYDTNVRTCRLAGLASMIPQSLRRLLSRIPLPERAAAIVSRAALGEPDLIASAFKLGGYEGLVGACRIDLPNSADDEQDLFQEIGFSSREGTFLDRLLFFQLKTYLIALLMKQDKMSMAASIETRVPYLDHHLVELAFSLPDACKVRGNVGKYQLKQASLGLLPEKIIHRPKRGFPVPISRWFREPGNPFMDVLLDPQSLRDGYLDAEFVRSRVHHFQAGAEISLELWTILNLELWRQEFMCAT